MLFISSVGTVGFRVVVVKKLYKSIGYEGLKGTYIGPTLDLQKKAL